MAAKGASAVVELSADEFEKWCAEDALAAATNDGLVRYAVIELMTMWSPPSQYFGPECVFILFWEFILFFNVSPAP